MNEEQAFLDALAADPTDDGHRGVYADWLEERGETDKADYLRSEVKLAGHPPDSPSYWRLAQEMDSIRWDLDPDWLRAVSRPARTKVVEPRVRGRCRWCPDEKIRKGFGVEFMSGMFETFVCRKHYPDLVAEERQAEEEERAVPDIETDGQAVRLLNEEMSVLGLTPQSLNAEVAMPGGMFALFRRSPVFRKALLYVAGRLA